MKETHDAQMADAIGHRMDVFPVVVLFAMPWLVEMMSDLEERSALADRIFYQQLFRAMPDVMFWLSLCEGFGFINGTIRLIACANNEQS